MGDLIPKGTQALGGPRDSTRRRKGLPRGSLDGHLPSCPHWRAGPASAPVHPILRDHRPCHCPVSTAGGLPRCRHCYPARWGLFPPLTRQMVMRGSRGSPARYLPAPPSPRQGNRLGHGGWKCRLAGRDQTWGQSSGCRSPTHSQAAHQRCGETLSGQEAGRR